MDLELTPGVYEVTTATGSLYELVVGEETTLRRLPKAVTPEASHADLSTGLRRDAEAISVLRIPTLRETSSVQRIQRTADAPADTSALG